MIDARTAPYAALVLRVSLGIMFLAHGLVLKVMTYGLPGSVGYFESIGFSAVIAYIVIAAEIAGGIALILGLWTRAVSLLFLPLMIGATLQHVGNGWMFGNPNGGWEFPVFWTVALLVQALLGPGAYALKADILPGLAPSPASAR